jgi:hypothetical protein
MLRSTTRGAAVVATIVALAVGSTALQAQAVISNGTVSLGVNQRGALNVTSAATPYYSGVGVRHVPSGWDGTYDGCTCEGWGAGIAGGAFDAVWGGQNTANDGSAGTNLFNPTFTSTASTASSGVTIRSGTTDVLRVTHDYAPSPATPNLYQVSVTLTNLTGATLGAGSQGIRYRRMMDWDVPTPGDEVVSFQGWGATNLIATSTDPFVSENPFGARLQDCTAPLNANFTNIGPCDFGLVFDFAFPELAVGASRTLKIFYGAAANLAGVRTALGAVGAEVATWAYCGTGVPVPSALGGGSCVGSDGPTFVFAFEGVGGSVIEPPPPPVTGVVPEPSTYILFGTGLLGVLGIARRRRASAV